MPSQRPRPISPSSSWTASSPAAAGDLLTLDLGRRFDIVTCLFSSIGYVADLAGAVERLAAHAAPGGVVVVEPWLAPEQIRFGHVGLLTAEADAVKVARMTSLHVDGRECLMEFQYLIGRPGGITPTAILPIPWTHVGAPFPGPHPVLSLILRYIFRTFFLDTAPLGGLCYTFVIAHFLLRFIIRTRLGWTNLSPLGAIGSAARHMEAKAGVRCGDAPRGWRSLPGVQSGWCWLLPRYARPARAGGTRSPAR